MKLFNHKQESKQEGNQSYILQRRHILGKNSSFYVQEAYKTLRTNIRFFLSGDGCKKFCITSGLASEGKSITILNLAISFAEAGAKVLLVDADLRRPSMARLLIENASPGLSNVLAGLCKPEDAIRTSPYPNLDVLFSGEIPPNPSELLGNERMTKMLEKLSLKYDYILMDTPPVGVVSDVCVIGQQLDGVLFLVRQNYTEKEAVARGIKQLEISGAKLMGFVLNGADKNRNSRYNRKYKYKSRYGYYRYGYRYGYGYGYSRKGSEKTSAPQSQTLHTEKKVENEKK